MLFRTCGRLSNVDTLNIRVDGQQELLRSSKRVYEFEYLGVAVFHDHISWNTGVKYSKHPHIRTNGLRIPG